MIHYLTKEVYPDNMSEEEKKKTIEISRRKFLKDAGLVVGGASIGSMAFLNACKGGETITKTVTNTATSTVTTTAAATTVTVNKFVCPVDGQEFPTLDDLKAHYNAAHPGAPAIEGLVTLTVNDVNYVMKVEPWWPLSFVLRDQLGLFGLKVGCDHGNCGTCTVLADGVPVFSCLMLAIECQGKKLTTIEALSNGSNLSPLQQKFYNNEAFQCGYCTPGILLASTALLANNPKPTADDVRAALAGHLCFCGNFLKVVETVTGGV